jgi:hypothetical protein
MRLVSAFKVEEDLQRTSREEREHEQAGMLSEWRRKWAAYLPEPN